MLLGVMAGRWLRGSGSASQKVRGLVIAGVFLLVAGIVLDPAILPGVNSMRWTICPIIKRLWTPSYVLYSGGWVMLIATLCCIGLVDICGVRRWTFPFVVVGMNSIVMYLLGRARCDLIRHAALRDGRTSGVDSIYGPIFESLAVLAIPMLAHLPVSVPPASVL